MTVAVCPRCSRDRELINGVVMACACGDSAFALGAKHRGGRKAIGRRRSKYNNQRVQVDGHWFDSKAEANYYIYLRGQQTAGEISNLELQPKFELQPGFTDNAGKRHQPITYKADFSYIEDGRRVVVDAKGHKTAVFRLKEKMLRYKFPGLDFRVVKV